MVDLAGARTLFIVPMLKENELVGVITIFRQEVRPFTDKQIELVQNFAAQAVIAVENTRLLNELRESLQQQTATADVLKVISSSPGDLAPVFRAMLGKALQLCEAKFGIMFRYADGVFRATSWLGDPPAYTIEQPHVVSENPHNLLTRIVYTKQPVYSSDLTKERAYIEGNPRYRALVDTVGARSLLVVPMLNNEDLIGAIAIYWQETRSFTEKQMELISNFAAQAVIAIDNARLLSELRESLQQQTATADVLKVISRSPGELDLVFQAMLENATRICEARFGNLVLYENENGAFRMAAMHGAPPEFAEKRGREPIIHPSPKSPLFRVAKTRQLLHIIDLRIDEAYVDGDLPTRAFVELAGTRTIVVVPMLKDDKLIGAIGIYRQEVRPFTDKQIELVQNFAAQAVIAIENTRLLNELRESLQQQTATADVLKVISRSTFDLQAVLDALIETATHLCNADQGSITREIEGAFFRAASYGYSSELSDFIRKTPVLMDRSSVAGRALVEGRVVHIADVKADPEYTFSPGLDLGEFRTAIGVPMLREGVPIGVLALTRKDVRPFTEKQIELVTTFADQAAIAIENVRLFESVEARTRELAASLEDLRTTQDRLVQTQKLASLGQLTAGIAHEIKNPLNFVNNFSVVSSELIDELQDALKDMPFNDKARADIKELTDTLKGNLDKVVQHGKRADAIVKNMLLHSREGSGEHRVVDINAIVEESLNLAYHGARAEKQGFTITLQRSFDPSAGEIDAFPQEVTRALLNLISNGFYAATKRKAATNGDNYEPTLTAATKNLGDRVEISIRDNGIGIPPDVKAKIFNPFFTTKPAGEGTGLGLSISHDIIVKQHGGSIEVDTQPGEFTEIRVILPRVAVFV
jgi:GAF domain-containing protein